MLPVRAPSCLATRCQVENLYSTTCPHVGQSTARSWSTEIGCGDWHTIAVRRDGTALATGNNQRGQTDVARWTHLSGVSAGYPAHRRLTRRRHRRRRQRRQQRPVRGVIVEKHHLSSGRLRPYARAEPDRKGLRNGRQPVRPVRCPVMDRHHSDRSRSETLARAARRRNSRGCGRPHRAAMQCQRLGRSTTDELKSSVPDNRPSITR